MGVLTSWALYHRALAQQRSRPNTLTLLLKTEANCGSEVRAGQGRTLRPLPVLAVARNCSFRFEKSFIRFKASFSETTARRGRSTLTSLMSFSLFTILPSFFLGHRSLSIANLPSNLQESRRDEMFIDTSRINFNSRAHLWATEHCAPKGAKESEFSRGVL